MPSGYWTPTKGLISEWGAEHDCRQCGAPVQVYGGPRTPWHITFNAGTWKRHCCGARIEIPDVLECYCGAQTMRYTDGHKEDQDGTPHTCKPRPTRTVQKMHIAPAGAATRNDGGVLDL